MKQVQHDRVRDRGCQVDNLDANSAIVCRAESISVIAHLVEQKNWM